jgi:hypothetical protein
MSYRTLISLTAAAIVGMACVSTDALAYRGGRAGGVHAGGVRVGGVHAGGARYGYHGGYRGAYVGRGVAVGVGAAAVGAAVARPACGYYPYGPCY